VTKAGHVERIGKKPPGRPTCLGGKYWTGSWRNMAWKWSTRFRISEQIL